MTCLSKEWLLLFYFRLPDALFFAKSQNFEGKRQKIRDLCVNLQIESEPKGSLIVINTI